MKLENTQQLRKALEAANDNAMSRVSFHIDIFRMSGPSEIARKLRSRAIDHGLEPVFSMQKGLIYHRVNMSVTGANGGILALLDDVEHLEEISDAD